MALDSRLLESQVSCFSVFLLLLNGSDTMRFPGVHASFPITRGKRAADVETGPVPFIGRTLHLEQIERCLHTALTERPQVLLLEGEAGVGKTRLLKAAILSLSS